MIRNTLLSTIASFVLLTPGCDTPAEKQKEEHVEARKNVVEAGKDAKAKTAEANDDLAEAERKHTKEVGAAQLEVAQAVVAAQEKVVVADATAAKAKATDRYEHFADLTTESESTFDGRAGAAITELQTDLDAARKRASGSDNAAMGELLRNATLLVATANTHLTTLRGKTGKVLDDGQVGAKMAVQRVDVGMAINSARDANEAVYGQLAVLAM